LRRLRMLAAAVVVDRGRRVVGELSSARVRRRWSPESAFAACPRFPLLRAFSARARARFSWRFSLISRSTISPRLVTRASPPSLGRRPRFAACGSGAPWVLRGRPARRPGPEDAISAAVVVIIVLVFLTPPFGSIRFALAARAPSGMKKESTAPQCVLPTALKQPYGYVANPRACSRRRRTS
jgi:hypothetical protein